MFSPHHSVELNLEQHIRINESVFDHNHRSSTTDFWNNLCSDVAARGACKVVLECFAHRSSVFLALIASQYGP